MVSKKLVVNKMTLRALTSQQMSRVAGGYKKTDPMEQCSYTHVAENCRRTVQISLDCNPTDYTCADVCLEPATDTCRFCADE